MKKQMFLSLLFGLAAAASLTSCLDGEDNDSNNTLTKVDRAVCFGYVRGHHIGKVIYPAQNPANYSDTSDTLATSWTIDTDSTLTIDRFPSAALAHNITDATLREALAAAPDQSLKCHIGFITKSPVQFLINPQTPSYTLDYGEKTHKVQVAFYINNYSSFGVYDIEKNKLALQIVAAALYVDGHETSLMKSGIPFVFVADK
jgi:hypothetical protein